MMDKMQALAAETALKKMLVQGYFCICTIDQIIKMTGSVPPAREYDILRMLHCVNYKDMPAELRDHLPELVRVVLTAPGLQFDLRRNNVVIDRNLIEA